MHVLELLPAYTLDCLGEEETTLVSEHLAHCPACRAEFQAFQTVADQLALAAPEAAPPPRLKRQILERVQPPRPQPAGEARPSWWQQLAGLFQRAAPAWGAVALILVVVLAASILWLWQRLDGAGTITTSGGMQVIALAGTEVAPDGTGTLVISADGEHGTLIVDGLPDLDEDQQYQLWLIRDEQRTSGGVFSVNDEGYGALWISSPEPLSSYPAFGITVEPAGGSPGPTGEKVLGGSL